MLGKKSQNMDVSRTLLKQNILQKCPSTPNCVSSFEDPSNSQHYISAINYNKENIDFINIKECKNIIRNQRYHYYQCDTLLFGFIDDLEILYLKSKNKIYFRSASRVGYSDLGKNRKRVQSIIEGIKQ
ncbi:MAG: DUF1499 domain-containing protein [Bacteriovoracaceae bacterium]|nr:DUF1499 domain-containing protein [Bacteriovoracaceae bacterium]